MNKAIKIFEYEGNRVTFDTGDGIMVNATEMAKPFGKEVRQWFDNPGTHEFIHALAQTRGLSTPMGQKRTSLNASQLAQIYPTLIKVVKGGLGEQGTWMHEDVALEFARWLAPHFAIWCNDRVKELLLYDKREMVSSNEKNRLNDNTDFYEKFNSFILKNYNCLNSAMRLLNEFYPTISLREFADFISDNLVSTNEKNLAEFLHKRGAFDLTDGTYTANLKRVADGSFRVVKGEVRLTHFGILQCLTDILQYGKEIPLN